MFFDFDAGKLIIIGIVALVVIGPKELPRVMRQVGQAIGKMRRMAADFQSQFMEAMREADLADIKAEAAKLAEQTRIDVDFNPIHDLKSHVTQALDAPATIDSGAALTPIGEAASALDLPQETAAPALPDLPPATPVNLAGAGIAPVAEPAAVPVARDEAAHAGLAHRDVEQPRGAA